ncbi:MAG: hypothetical protein GXP49_01570 [Deltaproteobacteria bacterium]|nr:hypothetical protein [Deltaproteobacteria bacterium]
MKSELGLSLPGLDLFVQESGQGKKNTPVSCRKGFLALALISPRVSEVKLQVRICATGSMISRWAPFDDKDPDRLVTVAHLLVALIKAGVADGPLNIDEREKIELTQEEKDGSRAQERNRAITKKQYDGHEKKTWISQDAGKKMRRGTGNISESVEFTDTDTRENKDSGEIKGPPPGGAKAGLYGVFEISRIPGAEVGLAGGLGLSLTVTGSFSLGLAMSVYSGVKGEHAGYSADLQAIPLILQACYRKEYPFLRLGGCIEGAVKFDSVKSRANERAKSRYDLSANPGLGGSLLVGTFLWENNLFLDLDVFGTYYFTSQKYTVMGKTIVETARYVLGARTVLGVRF